MGDGDREGGDPSSRLIEWCATSNAGNADISTVQKWLRYVPMGGKHTYGITAVQMTSVLILKYRTGLVSASGEV